MLNKYFITVLPGLSDYYQKQQLLFVNNILNRGALLIYYILKYNNGLYNII